MKKQRFPLLLACALFVSAALLPGCNSREDDGLTDAQRQQGSQLSEIAKRTGGDWNKATQEDKDALLKMAFGNEDSAKRMLSMYRAGPSGPGGGGPPGQPGGPPGRPGGPPGR